jgi:hypothetical protein
MSVGHPGESEDTINETRKWLIEVSPSDFDVTIITPYPGSHYYDQALLTDGNVWTYTCKNGDQLHQMEVNYAMSAAYYKGDPKDGYVSHVWTNELNPHDLVRLRNALEIDTRQKLNIPFNQSTPSKQYEHSMGQTVLPDWILRSN